MRDITVARAALKRKKQHEHSLDQTTAQIATLEQQIYSIEAANINQETLKAMQKAGKAMKEIHGGLTIDKVDATMYVLTPHFRSFSFQARFLNFISFTRRYTKHSTREIQAIRFD